MSCGRFLGASLLLPSLLDCLCPAFFAKNDGEGGEVVIRPPLTRSPSSSSSSLSYYTCVRGLMLKWATFGRRPDLLQAPTLFDLTPEKREGGGSLLGQNVEEVCEQREQYCKLLRERERGLLLITQLCKTHMRLCGNFFLLTRHVFFFVTITERYTSRCVYVRLSKAEGFTTEPES